MNIPLLLKTPKLRWGLAGLVFAAQFGAIAVLAQRGTPEATPYVAATERCPVQPVAGGAFFVPHDADLGLPSADVIESFTVFSLTSLLSSSDSYPNGARDAGVAYGNHRLPTSVWYGQFSLSEDEAFRRAFMQQLAGLIPFRAVLEGELQTALDIRDIAAPRPIAEGEWVVEVKAYLLMAAGEQRRRLPFNRAITLKFVAEPEIDTDDPTAAAAARLVGQSSLEIIRIRPLGKE